MSRNVRSALEATGGFETGARDRAVHQRVVVARNPGTGYAEDMGGSRPDSFVHPTLYLEDIPSDVLKMYVDYLEGATISEVATRYGRDPGRVGQLFAECGLEKRSGGLRPALPPRRPPDAVASVEQERLSPEDRRRAREQAKNERRKRERRIRRAERERLRLARIIDMYVEYLRGKTQREVGEDFGISDARVGQLFKEAGFATRPPRARRVR
jgi:hypothetical protein